MANKGGSRPGAGRPCGTGIYKEPTVQIRVPKSLLLEIKKMLADFKKNLYKKDKDSLK